jgi:hypothetical protein
LKKMWALNTIDSIARAADTRPIRDEIEIDPKVSFMDFREFCWLEVQCMCFTGGLTMSQVFVRRDTISRWRHTTCRILIILFVHLFLFILFILLAHLGFPCKFLYS